jgi:hypothetical protein
MTQEKKTERGDNFMKSSKKKYFNSPSRQRTIKNAIEQLVTYKLNTAGRRPTREEKNAAIALGFAPERDSKDQPVQPKTK